MRMTDLIADVILDLLNQADGTAQIQRNNLAQQLGCVPSQINYVLTSRFTPEQGYQVESRRGGGGYILITRANPGRSTSPLMHTINSIGDCLDEKTCRAHIYNLHYQNFLSQEMAALMLAATGESALRDIPAAQRGKVRSTLFKQMLLAAVQQTSSR